MWALRTLGGREDMENLDKVLEFIGIVCRLDVLPEHSAQHRGIVVN
jgi:hypothetical protein